ncbi:MAG: alpha/beta hydrolase [Ruminococcaceae bacterium]|nr:alpha/beta hydrolase [Oscillospiraceae bacterium]
MEFEIRTLPLTSTDNIHTLEGKIYIPKGEIKGLFHLVHGMTEYIDRYDHLFTFLAQNGYVAFGFDNLGHGKTARENSELGFIAHKNGWKYLVHDCIAYSKAVKEMFPQKPLVLMGHSMGSFITRLAVEYAPEIYDKFIICGTSGPNLLAKFGLIYAKLAMFIQGEKHVSNTVYNLAFGSYNKRFRGATDYEWLTKDRQIIDKYSADKYCTFKFTLSAMIDLMKLVSGCNRAAWFKTVKKDLPILLVSGEDDPVGNYGKGVTAIYDKLKLQNTNVSLKLYKNCRHEIHNDSCKDEMFEDILQFLN